ncbi:hypothetical protein TWF730_006774 [Orbilia blumenaviensis]|uniref:Uncharacterized protein n=1 Tax=Orbilia blumenaviensis TaxID=1796055 RepID=A0AAV9VFS3_9PEZI
MPGVYTPQTALLFLAKSRTAKSQLVTALSKLVHSPSSPPELSAIFDEVLDRTASIVGYLTTCHLPYADGWDAFERVKYKFPEMISLCAEIIHGIKTAVMYTLEACYVSHIPPDIFHEKFSWRGSQVLVRAWNERLLVVECPVCKREHMHEYTEPAYMGFPIVYEAPCIVAEERKRYYQAVFPYVVHQSVFTKGVGYRLGYEGEYWVMIDAKGEVGRYPCLLKSASAFASVSSGSSSNSRSNSATTSSNITITTTDTTTSVLTNDSKGGSLNSTEDISLSLTAAFSAITLSSPPIQSSPLPTKQEYKPLPSNITFDTSNAMHDISGQVEQLVFYLETLQKAVQRYTPPSNTITWFGSNEKDRWVCLRSSGESGKRPERVLEANTNAYIPPKPRTACLLQIGRPYKDVVTFSGKRQEFDLVKTTKLYGTRSNLETSMYLEDALRFWGTKLSELLRINYNKYASAPASFECSHAEKKLVVHYLVAHGVWRAPWGIGTDNMGLQAQKVPTRVLRLYVSQEPCNGCRVFMEAVMRKFHLCILWSSSDAH